VRLQMSRVKEFSYSTVRTAFRTYKQNFTM